ncbi:hypothetical protein M407DRAFT_177909 [Tulasnella calospora MUT 4182]|uniref:N-acetyltransferase domain-containing protein n=1 Tax=Tulasnella calospora MUT 4182 TaxID=1051891 RepID=A0A0C3QLU9_9AGAM|nr:hypothetical protein M407DRAFT_177909 [Tulasnella calospora MUT 4182]
MASPFVSSTTRTFSPPLHYDEETNEPYLPLAPPFGPRIRLTPPRLYDPRPTPDSDPDAPHNKIEDDVAALVKHHNLAEIYMFLTGPPRPYTEEYAKEWLKKRKTESQALIDEMDRETSSYKGLVEAGTSVETDTPTPRLVLSGCPVRVIRERLDDGTDVFLGDCFLARSHFPEIADLKERERRTEENYTYEKGDPRIVYSFGMFLSPSAHGRGIMSATVQTLIEQWAVPVMAARQFEVAAMSHNVGSQKVFLKNGFALVNELEDAVDLEKLGKGEGKAGLKLYRREVRSPEEK